MTTSMLIRPFVTTGIAVVGAGVLLVSPVGTAPRPQLHTAHIALTQLTLPEQVANDITTLAEDFTAGVTALGPGLNSLVGAGFTTYVVNGYLTLVDEGLPLLEAIYAGQSATAFLAAIEGLDDVAGVDTTLITDITTSSLDSDTGTSSDATSAASDPPSSATAAVKTATVTSTNDPASPDPKNGPSGQQSVQPHDPVTTTTHQTLSTAITPHSLGIGTTGAKAADHGLSGALTTQLASGTGKQAAPSGHTTPTRSH